MPRSNITVAVCLLATGAVAQEQHAHSHGASALNIAVDGDQLTLELAAPGMDLVGFEHEPSTPEQVAAVENVHNVLGAPLELFAPSSGAGCTIVSAQVHGAEHEREEAAEPALEEAEGDHFEFGARYELACSNIGAMTSLDLAGYFATFAGVVEVEVEVISRAGYLAEHADRDQPVVDLSAVF